MNYLSGNSFDGWPATEALRFLATPEKRSNRPLRSELQFPRPSSQLHYIRSKDHYFALLARAFGKWLKLLVNHSRSTTGFHLTLRRETCLISMLTYTHWLNYVDDRAVNQESLHSKYGIICNAISIGLDSNSTTKQEPANSNRITKQDHLALLPLMGFYLKSNTL